MSLTQPILSDIFLSEDVKRILHNKYVLFIGDSVIRSMYKDLVKLYQKNEHLADVQLKYKGELSFENDRLLEGGQFGTLSNETTYTEVRELHKSHVLIRFYFITRCYSNYLKSICQKIKRDQKKPDVVIMNSCYWDLSRYGVNSVEEYKLNVPKGVQSLLDVLPKEAVFIWTGALPVSKEIIGGFMGGDNIDQKVRMRMRENIVEANRFAAQVMNDFGVDFLDLHYYFRLQQFRRAYDGIHWDSTAHRRISNLLLHHLCECWGLTTPGRFAVSVREPINLSEAFNKIKSVELNKIVDEKKDNNEKEVEEDGEIGVIKVVDDNKGKRDEEKLNETSKKITEEKINSAVDDKNLVLISSDSSYSSSPNSSNPLIKNSHSNKTKETPKRDVNENKKQRRETNSNQQFNDNQKKNSNNNNNTNSYLFESTCSNSYYSFFMKNQTPNFNDDHVFNHNRTAYNFTDNMLNYTSSNFSNNQNPFAQNYNNNGYNYSGNDRKPNNNNQMSSSYSSNTNNSISRRYYR